MSSTKKFLCYADTHFKSLEDRVEAFIEDVRMNVIRQHVDGLIVLGDVLESYQWKIENPSMLISEIKSMISRAVDKADFPIYFAPGNHDFEAFGLPDDAQLDHSNVRKSFADSFTHGAVPVTDLQELFFWYWDENDSSPVETLKNYLECLAESNKGKKHPKSTYIISHKALRTNVHDLESNNIWMTRLHSMDKAVSDAILDVCRPYNQREWMILGWWCGHYHHKDNYWDTAKLGTFDRSQENFIPVNCVASSSYTIYDRPWNRWFGNPKFKYCGFKSKILTVLG
jgi:DNA repair exonuclease SbcCD nuclease subunit